MRVKALFFLLPFLFACSHIDEDERLIEVGTIKPVDIDTPTTTERTLLLEDFTGQMCVNCPLGTEVIEQLQEAYGDRVIAVGIHGGPLGFKGSATVMGLATAMGDEYYNHWGLEYQPVGLIDRHGAVNYTEWITAVRQELGVASETRLALDATLSGSQVSITVGGERLGDSYSGRLQVWLLEDAITATQKMPDGTNNRGYVHNHVLRTAVNGIWGQDIALEKGQTLELKMTQAVDPGWKVENLSVVAFIYNDSGVEQAVKTKVTISNK